MRDLATLGDVLLEIQAGKSFLTSEILARPDELGVLKVSAVTWTDFRPDEAKALLGAYEPAESHKVKNGDLIISRANTKEFVGAVVLVQGDYPNRLLSDKTLRLVVDEALVCKDYLLFALRSSVARKHIELFATGTSDSMRNISQDVIISIPLHLPPLNDQRGISLHLKANLAEVERARRAAEKRLQDSALLRTRASERFLMRLDSVEAKRLGDYATTTSGSTPSRAIKQYWEPAEIPWVKTGEVTFSEIKSTEEAISRQALAECSLMLLPPKSVLVAMIGQGKTRGQSAILGIEATTNQNCFAVLPNETWDSEFLYYWFMASYQRLRTLSADRGGSQAALNGTLLSALRVPAPDKEEQLRIVQQVKAALLEVDALTRQSKAMLADIEQLPTRILARAFEN